MSTRAPGARSIAGLVARLGHCTYGDSYRDGLKPAQWCALRYFGHANRFSRTTSAFARYQGISCAAASQTIGSLVEKGLLERTPDPTDGRRHHLSLTNSANDLSDADPIATLVASVKSLAKEERTQLASSLEKVLENLIGDDESGQFGYCNDCCYLKRDAEISCTERKSRCVKFSQSLVANDLREICINFSPLKTEGPKA